MGKKNKNNFKKVGKPLQGFYIPPSSAGAAGGMDVKPSAAGKAHGATEGAAKAKARMHTASVGTRGERGAAAAPRHPSDGWRLYLPWAAPAAPRAVSAVA